MFNKGNKVEKPAYSGLPFYLNILDDNLFAMVEQLTFPIGSRTNWHKNPCGQTILVTKGAMIYQEEGSVPHVTRSAHVGGNRMGLGLGLGLG